MYKKENGIRVEIPSKNTGSSNSHYRIQGVWSPLHGRRRAKSHRNSPMCNVSNTWRRVGAWRSPTSLNWRYALKHFNAGKRGGRVAVLHRSPLVGRVSRKETEQIPESPLTARAKPGRCMQSECHWVGGNTGDAEAKGSSLLRPMCARLPPVLQQRKSSIDARQPGGRANSPLPGRHGAGYRGGCTPCRTRHRSLRPCTPREARSRSGHFRA